jgi:predicted ATP-grasp superfamily ATP-dependent carboligase
MIVINAYSVHSKSANQLADAMKVPLLGKFLSLTKYDPGVTVINWGSGKADLGTCTILNKPEAVRLAVNKLKSFKVFREAGVRTPDWTTDVNIASGWLPAGKVVARARLEGRDGDGLSIHSAGPLPPAKLYTKFIPGCTEYRVSVVGDKHVGVQKKVVVPGKPEYNHEVKTTAGGYGLHWINGWEHVPGAVTVEAIKAVKALGLDFGGVDVIYRQDEGARVLEVNTAPELTPTLLQRYSKYLMEAVYGT